MSIGLVFWIIMLLWIVSIGRNDVGGLDWPLLGLRGSLLFFILFFLLGWHDFGFIIHQ